MQMRIRVETPLEIEVRSIPERPAKPKKPERRRKRVRIRTKEKCPKCSRAFKETRFGLVCIRCKTKPSRYFIDLSWKGRRIKIYSFRDGQPLSSYELARRAQEVVTHEIARGVFDPSKWIKSDIEDFLLAKLIQDYLEAKKDIKPAAWREKKNILRMIEKEIDVSDVREVQPIHLHNLAMSWSRQGLSPKTVRNRLVEFRAFLNWLWKRGIISEVPPLPEVKVQEPPIKWLDAETQERILSFIPEKDRPIFEFLFMSGCRIGEARALMWDCVNFNDGVVVIKRTFSADRLVESPKEGREKAIPLVGRLREILEELAKNKVSLFVFAHKVPGYKEPRPYSSKFLSNLFKEACRKAGVQEDITLYQAVRHSFAMQLLKLGFTYEQIGAALGHRNPSTTRRYGRLQAHMVAPVFEAKQKVISLNKRRSSKKRGS